MSANFEGKFSGKKNTHPRVMPSASTAVRAHIVCRVRVVRTPLFSKISLQNDPFKNKDHLKQGTYDWI
jgi:hypothetical protein